MERYVITPEAKREAAEIAKDAAPYIHPRLASIDQTIKEDRPFALVPGQLSMEEYQLTYGPQARSKTSQQPVNKYQEKSIL
jgi:hypothetical protein